MYVALIKTNTRMKQYDSVFFRTLQKASYKYYKILVFYSLSKILYRGMVQLCSHRTILFRFRQPSVRLVLSKGGGPYEPYNDCHGPLPLTSVSSRPKRNVISSYHLAVFSTCPRPSAGRTAGHFRTRGRVTVITPSSNIRFRIHEDQGCHLSSQCEHEFIKMFQHRRVQPWKPSLRGGLNLGKRTICIQRNTR
jgi:hypothetical protein